MIESSIKLPCK